MLKHEEVKVALERVAFLAARLAIPYRPCASLIGHGLRL
jgi:hypothetical protein